MECIICREDLLATGKGSYIRCGHIYHAECIIKWIRVHQNCPLCRAKSTCNEIRILVLPIAAGSENELDTATEIPTISKLLEQKSENGEMVAVHFPFIQIADEMDGQPESDDPEGGSVAAIGGGNVLRNELSFNSRRVAATKLVGSIILLLTIAFVTYVIITYVG